MPIEHRRDGGRLVWVRNPFTGVVTYFTHVHRKRSGFVQRQQEAALRGESLDRQALEEQLRRELDEAKRECPFCPGNEHLTTEELLRVLPAEVPSTPHGEASWLVRVFTNLIPRIPECCTGDRNESYVVVEDPRHFADDATGHEDLLYTALLPIDHFRAMLATAAGVSRRSYENPAVRAVVVRKNQGRRSGASQPHVHTQVIGSDLPFAPVVCEAEVTARTPGIWADALSFVDGEGFLIERRGPAVAYFCPWGTFPRSYEVVLPEYRGRFCDLPAGTLGDFAALLHQTLTLLGPIPLDYEIHDGNDVPLHAHVNARHFPYSNIAGTLNLPSTLLRE
jgi:galactose-1-phosphate uridylyltransferase